MQIKQRNVFSLEQSREGKSILKDLSSLGKKYGINEIVTLGTSEICVAGWVRLKCKYGCRKYGTSWCCPPETPSPNETKALLCEYEKALLLCGTARNSQFYMDNPKKRRIQVNAWKGAVALERRLFLNGYYKAFALVSENCALCKECSYPDACAFPMDRRPSVESCSIDIFQTLKKIGKPFRLAHDLTEEYDFYSIILLE